MATETEQTKAALLKEYSDAQHRLLELEKQLEGITGARPKRPDVTGQASQAVPVSQVQNVNIDIDWLL